MIADGDARPVGASTLESDGSSVGTPDPTGQGQLGGERVDGRTAGPLAAAVSVAAAATAAGRESGAVGRSGPALPRHAEFRYCVPCNSRGRLFVRGRCNTCRVAS